MNTTSISSNGRPQAHAASTGTSAAIASMFGADAATPSFNDQLAQLNPLPRAANATTAAADATDAVSSDEPAPAATSVLADAADQPAADAMADWIKDWLPAAGSKSPLASQLRNAGQAAGRSMMLGAGRTAVTAARQPASSAPGQPLTGTGRGHSLAEQLRDSGSPAARSALPGGLSDNTAAAQQTDAPSGAAVVRRAVIASPDSTLPHRPALHTDSPAQALRATVPSEPDHVRHAASASSIADTALREQRAQAAGSDAHGIATPRQTPAAPDAAEARHGQPVKPAALSEPAVAANRSGPALQQAQQAGLDQAGAKMADRLQVAAARPSTGALTPAERETAPAQLTGLAMTNADEPEAAKADAAQQPPPPVAPNIFAAPTPAAVQPAKPSADRSAPARAGGGDAEASGDRIRTPKASQQTGQPMPVTAAVLPPLQALPVDRSSPSRAASEASDRVAADEPASAVSEADEQRRPASTTPSDSTTAANPPALAALPLPISAMTGDDARPRGRRDAAAAGERVASTGSTATAVPANAVPAAAIPAISEAGSASGAPADAAGPVGAAPARPASAPDASTEERSAVSPASARGIEFAKALEQAAPLPIPTQGPAANHPAFASQAPLQVRLDTPVDAPDFRNALGVQVSVLARDGVESAELSLNPPEMGPISVRIELDGQHAHVEFRVDSAATRAVLESGLPELASALREAGLTLTGGGVSDHPRGQGDAPAQRQSGDQQAQHGRQGQTRSDGSRAGDDADLPRDTLRSRTAQLAGGVDLFA